MSCSELSVPKHQLTFASLVRLTKLDNWKTGILLAIKRQISEEPSLT